MEFPPKRAAFLPSKWNFCNHASRFARPNRISTKTRAVLLPQTEFREKRRSVQVGKAVFLVVSGNFDYPFYI
ncbi:MAG: hypothetical protein IJ558_11530 [Treponema sp.]|nr:hypothetical protein [Treponema sp.]